jgi:hypothetical protein
MMCWMATYLKITKITKNHNKITKIKVNIMTDESIVIVH